MEYAQFPLYAWHLQEPHKGCGYGKPAEVVSLHRVRHRGGNRLDIYRLRDMKNWIKNYVKNVDPNLDILCKATMLVPEDQLLDPLANEIGCLPDFNAYTMDKNPKPEGYSNCLRVAGEMIARKYGNIF